MTYQVSFPERLKNYRKMMGWTQEELAKEWSYSSDAISAWERSIRTPNGQQIPRIARLLEIHPEELMKSINLVHDRSNSHKGNMLTLDKDERDMRSALEAWGELQHIYPNRTEFNREIPYVGMFEKAHDIFASGISLNAITLNYGRENIVKAVLERKTTISLCFLDPDGANCAEREREERYSPGQLATLTHLNISIMENTRNYIRRFDPDSAQRLKLMIYDLPPRFNLYVFDDIRLVVESYGYVRGEDTPTFALQRQSDNGLFNFYASQARHIFEQAKPIGG
ncbi:MAG: DUF5919 domain-containing protein [Ktedonobacteraceae bacterium]